MPSVPSRHRHRCWLARLELPQFFKVKTLRDGIDPQIDGAHGVCDFVMEDIGARKQLRAGTVSGPASLQRA